MSRFTYLVESFLIKQQSNPNPTSVHCPRYHRRRRCYPVAVMITRFLTEVRVAFNPFSPRSKPARLFLSLIPADARASGMNVQSKLLPRTSKENATLDVKFSMYPSCIAVLLPLKVDRKLTRPSAEDGKEMKLNLSNMRITEVMEQVDRHSRMLARKEELTGN